MESNLTNSDQEHENYSVDEMMARLKRDERQKKAAESKVEGELLTREDGSQVMRVRKRKRRSKQAPKNENKAKNPKLKWIILGSIVGLFLLLIAGTIFIIAKYNGTKFKQTTEATITKLSGASETSLTKLRITPVSAKIGKAELSWGNNSFLKAATFDNLKADILATSFFTKSWIGEEILAQKGKIYLQAPAAKADNHSDSASPYKYDTFRCSQLDVHFGKEPNSPAIAGLENAALRKQNDGKHQIVFQGGQMNIESWPILKIFSGVIKLNSQDAQIEALLKAENGHKGELTIQGNIAKDTGIPVILDVKAKYFPIQEILGKELGRLIKGEINSDRGSLTYSYNKQPADALSFIMSFNSLNIDFSGLPLFTDLKTLTGDTQYLHPTFNHCNGTIMRTTEGITIEDLSLTSPGVLTMNGNISVSAKGALTGELEIGVPARLFNKNYPAPPIFSEPHNGNLITKVILGGSIHNPHDNLNELLKTVNAPRDPSFSPRAGGNDALQKEIEFEALTE